VKLGAIGGPAIVIDLTFNRADLAEIGHIVAAAVPAAARPEGMA